MKLFLSRFLIIQQSMFSHMVMVTITNSGYQQVLSHGNYQVVTGKNNLPKVGPYLHEGWGGGNFIMIIII